MDATQLELIERTERQDEPRRQWRLDEETRRIGLEGIARARRALRDAASRRSHEDSQSSAA